MTALGLPVILALLVVASNRQDESFEKSHWVYLHIVDVLQRLEVYVSGSMVVYYMETEVLDHRLGV